MHARRAPIAAVALLCLACGGSAAGAPPRTASPTPAASPSPPVVVDCASSVLSGLTTAQRVGQLLAVGLAGNHLGPAELQAIRGTRAGSVWFTATSQAGVQGFRAVADAVQAESAATAGVRFLVAANQEGGQVQALQGPGFSTIPSALQQGRIDPGALEQDARGWGQEMAAAGVNMDFAPVLDVVPPGTDAQNQPIGALQREYGHDPATAGSHGAAVVKGFASAGVASTIKHFPGLGRVRANTDFARSVMDGDTAPNDPYLQSFRQGVDAGAQFTMVALATYTRIDPNHLAAFSPAVMQLLRGLGFKGVIASDDLGAAVAVTGIDPATRAIDFVSAGGDLIVVKSALTAGQMASAMLAQTQSDPTFRGQVDDAALTVLRAKQGLGLLPCSAH